jgi:hypothetical protein
MPAIIWDGKYVSVEELAASAKLHAKVVRNELRLAFLSPDIVDAVLNGSGGFGLRDLRKCAAGASSKLNYLKVITPASDSTSIRHDALVNFSRRF